MNIFRYRGKGMTVTVEGKETGWCVSTFMLIFGISMVCLGCEDLSKEVVGEANRASSRDFFLGPEDVIEVTVWRNQDLSRVTVVRPDGMISLPLIGDVRASGATASQVAERIAKRLTEFKENPSVSVSVKEVNSYMIYVIGEVVKPGKYQLKSYATVLQGVSLAGGFTPFASKNKMVVVRMVRNNNGDEHQVKIPAAYDDLISGKSQVGNFSLMSGDTIVVP